MKSAYGRQLTIFLIGTCMGAISTAESVRTVRPASVPDEYVLTPFGYFHPSCVQRLAKGERLASDGRVQHADGSVAASTVVCNYSRYTPTGQPVASGVNPMLPEFSGWLENANVTTGSPTRSYGALIASWHVPPHPKATDGQVLFFFPGLEDIDNPQTSILQPVLQWAARQWSIASWNCCLSNIVTESPVIDVSPGDSIYGSITSACPAGTVSCALWNVLTVDLSTGESTILSNTPSDGQVFNWAFGGVVEPYYIVSCADYPPDQKLVFDDVRVFDEYLHPIREPKWTETFNSTAQPQCGYGVKATGDDIRLYY